MALPMELEDWESSRMAFVRGRWSGPSCAQLSQATADIFERGIENAKEYLCGSLHFGADSRCCWRGLAVFQESILGTAHSEYRHCFGVCSLLFEIPKEPVN
jgi:hypothetical protein